MNSLPFTHFTSKDSNTFYELGVSLKNKKKELTKYARHSYENYCEDSSPSMEEELFVELSDYLLFQLGDELENNLKGVKNGSWAQRIVNKCTESQLSHDCMNDILPFVKQAVWPHILTLDLPADRMMLMVQVLDWMMDMVREEMGKTFVQQQKNQVYQQTMKEMNAPLIPVSNELGILPFIGEIDTYKSQLVMESTTIERAQELELSTIILDLSGVSHIDTFVAQDIYNFSASLKLLGIEVVIVGFTPDIAQTSVHLNISFKQFTIYTNLAVALEQMKK